MKHILKPDILTLLHNYQRSSEQTIAGRLTVKVNDHTDTIATIYPPRPADEAGFLFV